MSMIEINVPNPNRDAILNRARKGTIAQFRVKDDFVYQEEMTTFKKAYVILDMFKDFGIGCGMPEGMILDPIVIPLPHMTTSAMEALIRWCYHHMDDPDMTPEELSDNLYHCTGDIKDQWDVELYNSLDEETLFDLLIAAKYLGVPEMRDSLTTYIANCIVQDADDKAKGIKPEDKEEEEEDGDEGGKEATTGHGAETGKKQSSSENGDTSGDRTERGDSDPTSTGDRSGPSKEEQRNDAPSGNQTTEVTEKGAKISPDVRRQKCPPPPFGSKN